MSPRLSTHVQNASFDTLTALDAFYYGIGVFTFDKPSTFFIPRTKGVEGFIK